MTKENWLVIVKPGKENREQRMDAEEGAELLGQIRSGNRPSDCKLEDISPEQWKALCDKEIATLKFS